MLIDRFRQGIRLIGTAVASIDRDATSGNVTHYATWTDERDRLAQSLDVPVWMNPSLVLATARTTSGM